MLANESPAPGLGEQNFTFLSNAFGDRYIYDINRDSFNRTGSDAVFSNEFGTELFAEDTFYLFVGTDSGQLIRFLQKRPLPEHSRYLFVELDPVAAAVQREIQLDHPAIRICSSENWQESAEQWNFTPYNFTGQTKLIRSLAVIDASLPDYLLLWKAVKEKYDLLRWAAQASFTFHFHAEKHIENLPENQIPASCMRDISPGHTAMLLAAGPSLDDHIAWIKQHRERLVVVAVSRVSKRLYEQGLTPDVIVSIDPYPGNFDVSRCMFKFQDRSILAYGYHVCPALAGSWYGRKTFIGPFLPWNSDGGPPTIPLFGPTVTNAAFALCLEMGFARIFLAGADFCFSADGYTHAAGSLEQTNGPGLMLGDQTLLTYSGQTAETRNDYLQAAHSLESLAAQAKQLGVNVFNLSAHAARLENIEHIDSKGIHLEDIGTPISERLNEAVPVLSPAQRVQHYTAMLAEIDRIQDSLRKIRELAVAALKCNDAMQGHHTDRAAYTRNKRKMDKIESRLDNKYAAETELVKKFGVRHFIRIVSAKEEQAWNEQDAVQAARLYYEAYRDTTRELLEILRATRIRLNARLEEEKPQANFRIILEQIRRDEQPGRVDVLLHRGTLKLEQMPCELRDLATRLHEQYVHRLEHDSEDYLQQAKKSSTLHGASGKAAMMFSNQDRAGLTRFVAGLRKHRDPASAEPVLFLCDGFIAELDKDTDTALDCYRRITAGPGLMHAMKRQLSIHLKKGNLQEAEHILGALAKVSISFKPFHADLLRILGQVQQAIDTYTDYLVEVPDDMHTLLKLARFFAELGVGEGVDITVRKVLELDPDNRAARMLAGSV